MKFEYNGKIIEYEIDRGKRKNIYIAIRDGKVSIKGPRKMSDEKVQEIIECKKKWIANKLEEEKHSDRKEKEEKYLRNEKHYRKEAEKKIPEIMEKMIALTGLKPNEYKLINFKRAWGNCSSKKVIKLNAKLVMYSDFAIAYVCLHELCHLKYMNHSKDFWNLVKSFMPDYKLAEEELK
jgi:hypothetical protein